MSEKQTEQSSAESKAASWDSKKPQRRKPPTFDEPVPTNETTEPCPLCAAPPGMPHGRGCAYAAEWVERERVWRLENAE
jgi:hypothetical protein